METKKYQCTSQNVPHFLVNSPRAFALSIIIWMATSEMYPPAENGIQSVQKMIDISHPLCYARTRVATEEIWTLTPGPGHWVEPRSGQQQQQQHEVPTAATAPDLF